MFGRSFKQCEETGNGCFFVQLWLFDAWSNPRLGGFVEDELDIEPVEQFVDEFVVGNRFLNKPKPVCVLLSTGRYILFFQPNAVAVVERVKDDHTPPVFEERLRKA